MKQEIAGAAALGRCRRAELMQWVKDHSWLGLWVAPFAIFGLDASVPTGHLLLVHGVTDELGHGLTAIVWHRAARSLRYPSAAFVVLAGGLGLDLDHLSWFRKLADVPVGTSRPVSHSLVTVLVLLLIAVGARRRRVIWISAALGVSSHLCRDLATGTLPFWWPWSTARVSMPYFWYVAVTIGLVAVTAIGAVQGRTASR